MRAPAAQRTIARMSAFPLSAFSDQLADVVQGIAPSVVQVHGHRRPVSGVAYANDIVLTSVRALGREDGVRVTTDDGRNAPAELVGWDPASGLAVLRARELQLAPAHIADSSARVGQLALPVARSWSNALTASAGIIAVIGGPLRSGRGHALEQVIRVTAPMHDGFAGGAVADASGRVIGVATNARIRGLAVVIPASLAWKSAAHVLEHGRPRVGFLGVSGQPVRLSERQRGDADQGAGLLIVAVTPEGPAESAGVLVGDVVLALDRQSVGSADDLLELLASRVGQAVPLRLLRGGRVQELPVTIGERPAS
jgi:S1-C subfamily serine protease